MNFTAGKARFEEGWFRTAWKRGGGEVGSGGQGGLLSCQAENLGVANTLLLTHCMRIGNQLYGRMFSFNLRTIQVQHVKGEQALVYRELELKVDALQDRS